MKIVWAWNKLWEKPGARIEMGVPRYDGKYGWQRLITGKAYCKFCMQVVQSPHSHNKTEFDKYKQYDTIAENGKYFTDRCAETE